MTPEPVMSTRTCEREQMAINCQTTDKKRLPNAVSGAASACPISTLFGHLQQKVSGVRDYDVRNMSTYFHCAVLQTVNCVCDAFDCFIKVCCTTEGCVFCAVHCDANDTLIIITIGPENTTHDRDECRRSQRSTRRIAVVQSLTWRMMYGLSLAVQSLMFLYRKSCVFVDN